MGKGKRYASPIFCFSASCSNLFSIGSDKLSTERPAHRAKMEERKKVIVMTSLMLMLRSPTVELHGELATLPVVHDGVGVVVGLPDHDVCVQLCTCSCSVQERSQAAPTSVNPRTKDRRLPFSISLPGVGKIL